MMWHHAIAVLLVSCMAGTATAGDTPDPRPNILFILADDLGWGDLGCYGHPHTKTPNLDRLAREGTLFTQFYVNASVCSPSRCAFMTGQYPARHRIHGHFATHAQNASRGMVNWLDPNVPNVARTLQKAGYATAHFGKWHLGSGDGAPPPTAYGFDVARCVNANGPTWEEADVTFRAKSTAVFVDEALQFIEERQGKPFYVNLWTLVPHATLNPTAEQMQPYRRFGPGGKDFPHRSAAEIYYSTVTDLDAQLGRLLQGLEDLGVADNTLILFTSDNGPEDIHIRNAGHSGIGSAGPFRGRKRSLYEGGIRVPGIVRWPSVTPVGKIDETSAIAGVDWLPTVCRAAGVDVPEGHRLDGEDVGDVLRGNPQLRSKPLMWEWRFGIAGEPFHQSPMLAILVGHFKLLMNPDWTRTELYHLSLDPTQLNNLATDHPDLVKSLGEQVLAWQAELPPGPVAPQAGSAIIQWPRNRSK